MKRNYYRLDMNGVIYWQSDNEGRFIHDRFEHRDVEELNYLYFNQINKNTYQEKLTGQVIKIIGNEIVHPLGVVIPLSNFTPCKSDEILESFDRLKKSNSLVEYNRIIKDLLVNSHYCELAKNKREGLVLKK